MVDINLSNFVSIGLMAVLFWALLHWAAKAFHIQMPDGV